MAGRTRRVGGRRTRADWFVVIMAGGRGERFWPMSRGATPKHLLRLLGDRSLLQQTVERVLPVVPRENVLVITNEGQLAEVRRQLPELPRGNVVAEPMVRDTAAAVALGAALVSARCASRVMAVLPSDHVIREEAKFLGVLVDGLRLAGSAPVMVTIGIPPTEPATGYGYLRVGESWRRGRGKGLGGRTKFCRVEQFVEKPPLKRAMEYVRDGGYRWNAGMFLWSCETVAAGLREHQPGLHEAWERWRRLGKQPVRLARALADDYPGLPRISIDYALMERADNVLVADGEFGWDDLGSWSALGRHLAGDAAGNRVVGEGLFVASEGNLVFDARTKRRTPIAMVGLRGVICVQTDDAVLLLEGSGAQRVKELVKLLGEHPRWRRLL